MPTPPDRALLKQAARQHGVITRAQARAAGLSDHQIDHRITRGQLLPARRGVYVLAGTERTWIQEMTVAWLWIGREAVVSHRSASRLWNLDGCGDACLEVTVRRKISSSDGVIVHRSKALPRFDMARVNQLLVTTPTRTMIDLGAVVETNALELALEDALRRRLTTVERLQRRLDDLATSGRKGSRALRRLLAERDPYSATESGLETKLWRFLRERKLPRPVRQYEVVEEGRVAGRPDFAYPDRCFAIEAHSYKHHSGRAAWESDLQRDRRLRRLGWKILYVTARDLEERPDEIEEEIRLALGISFRT